jgi:tRNA(Ile)-lysidine synthase
VSTPLAPEAARARPLGAAEFARLIEALGPFEQRARLAVAVSGGPDSLCLCLLAAGWAGAQGGAVTALIVDHGLRAEAAAEARQVAAWLRVRRIDHEVLRWAGPKPMTGIQAAAREARYRLLGDWCRTAGILHLLLGHHRDDQAETVALRQARQSGAEGLAGMAAVRELAGLRLLRPFLGVPKTRLLATLEALDQPWIEDPSNLAPSFARGRLRRGAGLDALGLAREAAEQARRRAESDQRRASWLALNARIDPAGFVVLAGEAVRGAPPEIGRQAMQQVLMTVGGQIYSPRQARLERLLEQLRAGLVSGRTLAGCRILPWRGVLLICREAQTIEDELLLTPGVPARWDGRFRLELNGKVPALTVRALGRAGTRALGVGSTRALPGPVRSSLPSLWRSQRLVAVPHLGLILPSLERRARISVCFNPASPLAGAPFHADGSTTSRPLLRPAESIC